MCTLFHHLIRQHENSGRTALVRANESLDYEELVNRSKAMAGWLQQCGLSPGDRVGIYLNKCFESVVSMFAASWAGLVFVPINPLLKHRQVSHILNDCGVRLLVSNQNRIKGLLDADAVPGTLEYIVSIDDSDTGNSPVPVHGWPDPDSLSGLFADEHTASTDDMVCILYTSGSTGKPKGVMLSHTNLVTGATSVSAYLDNRPGDRILAALPLSFDYGLSQLTTAFYCGASAVLMDYLLPQDVINAVTRYEITGLAGVPPLWNQLVHVRWPEDAGTSLRYITNSGGRLPTGTIDELHRRLPDADIYLMYGLTEAFRSTYLEPEQIEHRPTSMGRAIPNADISVRRQDGSLCTADEDGELVHGGPLVALGYWGREDDTALRFRPDPQNPGQKLVWSGDTVRQDQEGYLYFIGRNDNMIKSSGYRISPDEVESVLHECPGIAEAIAIGVGHPELGQAILALISGTDIVLDQVQAYCRRELPAFMVPADFILLEHLPRNPNGKIDRPGLIDNYRDYFDGNETE